MARSSHVRFSLLTLVWLAGCDPTAPVDGGTSDVGAPDTAVGDAGMLPDVDTVDAPGADAPSDAGTDAPIPPPEPLDCAGVFDCHSPPCSDEPACSSLLDGRDGDPCAQNRDCASGSCVRSGSVGFCSAWCANDDDCFGGTCVAGDCALPCDGAADCPAGLSCDDRYVGGGGPRVCLPADFSPRCGNGAVEPFSDAHEACDGADVPSCREVGFAVGTVACTDACGTDSSGCRDVCGDGLVTGFEQCDGPVPSCMELGFTGGTARCGPDCQFDTSGCTSVCGDGIVAPDEECDGSPTGDCSSVGETYGVLSCDPATCRFDRSACYSTCGDGQRGGAEECDGPETCRSLYGYFADDRPLCTAECRDSGIVCGPICGNGVREPGEGCDGTENLATCADYGLSGALGEVGCDAACQSTIGTCRRPPPPFRWTCSEDDYYDGDCDCGCGVRDPRCTGGERDLCDECPAGACAPAGCAGIGALYNHDCTAPVAPGWACAPSQWGDGVCDCGCDVRDIDCPTYSFTSCDFCTRCLSEGGTCATRVDPRDMSMCL
jgi:hypothetical protein